LIDLQTLLHHLPDRCVVVVRVEVVTAVAVGQTVNVIPSSGIA
jgi:hypothetical protein